MARFAPRRAGSRRPPADDPAVSALLSPAQAVIGTGRGLRRHGTGDARRV